MVGAKHMKNNSIAIKEETVKEKVAKLKKENEVSTDNNDTVYLAKSMTIREDQYMDITSLAAYNKLLRKKPDTASAVVREALDHYLSMTDDAYRYIGQERK